MLTVPWYIFVKPIVQSLSSKKHLKYQMSEVDWYLLLIDDRNKLLSII